MPDEIQRLRAVAAEWSGEVASNLTRAEVIEGRFGLGSSEHEHERALADLAESRAKLAAAHEELSTFRVKA